MKFFFTGCLLFLTASISAQNVGIGTTTPGYKLDVIGTGGYRGPSMFKSGIRVNGGGLFVANTDGNGQVLRFDGSNIQSSYSDPLVFPPQNLARSMVLNPYGGNVGIGTNFSPEYRLHVWSSGEQLVKIDGTNSLVLFHDNTSNAQYGFFRAWTSAPFNPAGYYGLEIGVPPAAGNDPAKRLMFSTNYALRLTIMEDGKTGINTPTPNSRLELNGSLSMPIRTVSATQSVNTFSVTDDDYTIVCDMLGLGVAGRVINLVLPSATGVKGRLYNVTAVNMGANFSSNPGGVKVYQNTVQGGTELWVLESRYNSFNSTNATSTIVSFQSDGANWQIISSNYFQYAPK